MLKFTYTIKLFGKWSSAKSVSFSENWLCLQKATQKQLVSSIFPKLSVFSTVDVQLVPAFLKVRTSKAFLSLSGRIVVTF